MLLLSSIPPSSDSALMTRDCQLVSGEYRGQVTGEEAELGDLVMKCFFFKLKNWQRKVWLQKLAIKMTKYHYHHHHHHQQLTSKNSCSLTSYNCKIPTLKKQKKLFLSTRS